MSEVNWSLILAVAIGLAIALALLFWGLACLRKSLKSPSGFQRGSGWTVQQIKELHQSGQLTDIQYRSLRDAVIRGLQKPQSENHSQR